MTDDEKTCPFCAEIIKAVAIKCKHCGSMLNANKNETDPDISREQSLTRTLLLSSGWIWCLVMGINLSLFKQNFSLFEADFVQYLGWTTTLNFSYFVLILVLYIKDRKSLSQKYKQGIPSHSNLFFIIVLPMIAIPLYFRYLRSISKFHGSLMNVSVGWFSCTIISLAFAYVATSKLGRDLAIVESGITNSVIENDDGKSRNRNSNNQGSVEELPDVNTSDEGPFSKLFSRQLELCPPPHQKAIGRFEYFVDKTNAYIVLPMYGNQSSDLYVYDLNRGVFQSINSRWVENNQSRSISDEDFEQLVFTIKRTSIACHFSKYLEVKGQFKCEEKARGLACAWVD